MKIEIAGSLFRSWLRHVRGCRLVQLNWKPSPRWSREHTAQIENLFQQSRDFFQDELNLDLFKKNRFLSQVLQQASAKLLERPSMSYSATAFSPVTKLKGSVMPSTTPIS